LWAGSVADAHVIVHSDEAVQGGQAEVSFRVPSESDTASTVKVQIAFPTDTPLASVSVLPHAGWTYKVTKSTLASPVPDGEGGQVTEAVSRLEWAAAGPDTAVKPGEYEVFTVDRRAGGRRTGAGASGTGTRLGAGRSSRRRRGSPHGSHHAGCRRTGERHHAGGVVGIGGHRRSSARRAGGGARDDPHHPAQKG